VSSLRLAWKFALSSITGALLLASLPCQVSAEEFRSPSDGIQSMIYEEGRLSLDARNASLDKLLSEVARMAMLTIVADGPIEGRVTVYTDRLPLEKALRKILRGKDTSFVYTAKADTSPAEYEVMEVRIYLEKAGQGEPRRYSYSRKKQEEDDARDLSRPRRGRGRGPGTAPRSPSASRTVPPIGPTEDAQRFISELMEGNLDGLDEIAQKLKDQNPQVEEQIEEFLESLEDIKARAGESGSQIPDLEGLGNMQNLMEQMMQRGRMPPGQKE
jgi:hypothetical protein